MSENQLAEPFNYRVWIKVIDWLIDFYFKCYATMQMLIFRVWPTCGLTNPSPTPNAYLVFRMVVSTEEAMLAQPRSQSSLAISNVTSSGNSHSIWW